MHNSTVDGLLRKESPVWCDGCRGYLAELMLSLHLHLKGRLHLRQLLILSNTQKDTALGEDSSRTACPVSLADLVQHLLSLVF